MGVMVRRGALRKVVAKLQRKKYSRVRNRFQKGTPGDNRVAWAWWGRGSNILSQLCRERAYQFSPDPKLQAFKGVSQPFDHKCWLQGCYNH